MIRYLFAFISIFAISAFGMNELDRATEFYKKGAYNEALQAYQSLLNPATVSASLYYNIGNCYYRTGKIGLAVLYFAKAHSIAPNDEDISRNLEVARLHAIDKIEPVPKFFLFRWIDNLVMHYSSTGWMKLLILESFILGIFALIFLFSNQIRIRQFSILATFIVFICLISSVFCLYGRYSSEKIHNTGVVVEYVTNVKNSPNNTASDAFVIHEGAVVLIEDRVDEWLKIRLEDGKLGWVQKGHISVI
ncbi:MAG: tetratricopeptide repeat protein [Ignavibacteria bacterium]|nr:tetratricopeptide repeat protein [Ignavibacteria bacterium]